MTKLKSRPVIVLFGRDGQLGWELRRSLCALGEVVALGRGQVDLTCPEEIARAIAALRPRLVVNAAAETGVDRAERDEASARAVNAVAPAVMAAAAHRHGAKVLHFSTDYVFDGKKREPYTETDDAKPESVYGRTKLEGDEGVLVDGAPNVVLRVAWVYGLRRTNFLLKMLELAREIERLQVVNDQFGAPTYCRLIAGASQAVAWRMLRGDDFFGLYHMPAGGVTTWYEMAQAIFDLAPRALVPRKPAIDPIATAARRAPAKRPAYSVLSGAALDADLGLRLPDWTEQLQLAFDDVAACRGFI